MKIGTARIGYSAKSGQRVLDTTVKSSKGLGRVFAPTWDMVMASKRGQISWPTYVQRYTDLMRERYAANPQPFLDALKEGDIETDTIVCCYCSDTHDTTKHCHRYVLVDILAKVAAHHNIELTLIGEVR